MTGKVSERGLQLVRHTDCLQIVRGDEDRPPDILFSAHLVQIL